MSINIGRIRIVCIGDILDIAFIVRAGAIVDDGAIAMDIEIGDCIICISNVLNRDIV